MQAPTLSPITFNNSGSTQWSYSLTPPSADYDLASVDIAYNYSGAVNINIEGWTNSQIDGYGMVVSGDSSLSVTINLHLIWIKMRNL